LVSHTEGGAKQDSVQEQDGDKNIWTLEGGSKGGCRKMHNNNELHGLHSLPNIIWLIKAMCLRWVDIWHAQDRREMHTGVL
jgi:hypothetical protein